MGVSRSYSWALVNTHLFLDSGRKYAQSRWWYNAAVTVDDRYCFKFLRLRRRAGSPRFADFLLWLWSESVFLALFNRKADSGDEKDSNSECCRLMFIASGA